MFITNGKTIFGNTGLIISLLILVILLYFSYNKCYVNNIESFDPPIGGNTSIPRTTISSTTALSVSTTEAPPPNSVRIKISGGSLIINFTIDISNKVPISFIIVLAQYDINKNNTGNNKFYLSNENILNPNSTTNLQQNILQNSLQGNLQGSLCTIMNGKPNCQYLFSNLDIQDSYGNIYYYKIGISALYENKINSVYVTPYNVTNSNKMFTLGKSIESQNLNQSKCNQTPVNNYDTISTADGQYELIKAQLGNYPDNLLIDSQKTSKGTLTDLVDKSMANALLNINVSANNPLA